MFGVSVIIIFVFAFVYADNGNSFELSYEKEEKKNSIYRKEQQWTKYKLHVYFFHVTFSLDLFNVERNAKLLYQIKYSNKMHLGCVCFFYLFITTTFVNLYCPNLMVGIAINIWHVCLCAHVFFCLFTF